MRHIWLVAVLLAASICGCITITVHSKVDRSGKLADYNMTITVPNLSGKAFNETNQTVGKNLEWVKKAGGEVTEKTYVTNSTITLITDIRNLDLSKLNNSSKFRIRIKKEGNYLIYRDYTFAGNSTKNKMSSQMASLIEVNYYLEMPGKIVDSNADKVKGSKAEWHFSGKRVIYAKCELPKSPGFGALEALVVIAVLALGLRRRV